MTPVCLAGPSAEIKRVEKWVERLKAEKGIALVSTWHLGAAEWSGRDARLTRTEQAVRSQLNAKQLREARIFWLLFPLGHSDGALEELGYARAQRWHVGPERLRIVVTGEGSSRTLCTADADYRDVSDELGFVEVVRLATKANPFAGLGEVP
jgi:hypothetical protein